MAYHNFIPYVTKGVSVKFICLDCGNEIEDEISVPWPDLESDNIRADDTIENDSIQCPNCERDYNYTIVSYGDLELDEVDDEQIDFADIFYDEDESDDSSEGTPILQKWNSRLILKEPSKKFIELVLKKDSGQDIGIIRREWFNEKISLKDSFFKEYPSQFTIYSIQSSGGRELLTYYVEDSDTLKFEHEMKLIWHILEDCYDEEWWKKEYGKFDSTCVLLLKKSKFVIAMHYRNE
jgi:DNA-directed RNA polymerase subunit RPC12/RpoP